MNIVGFDVSKHELVGVRINKRSQIQERYTLENCPKTIEHFLEQLILKYPHVTIGSEATAEYHNNLAKGCLEKNIPFYLLNPIVTKRFTKATVRKRKTDLTDAQVIAQCVLLGEGDLIYPTLFSPLKPIVRTCAQLAEMKATFSRMKNRFREHFPQEALIQKELKRLETETKLSIAKLQAYSQTYADTQLASLLRSIPGIGKTLSTQFVAEIGTIERFKNPKALIAFAGLDPKIRQSGTTLKRNSRLTKRGSPYLRRAAFLAASIAQRHDQELKRYFNKKKSEGKRYTEATIANARHILTRIYAVWKRGTPFIPKA